MATYIRKLKSADSNWICPATRAEAVYVDNTKLSDKLDEITNKLNGLFPAGSIYQSTSSTSPASFIGGDWARLYDRFLIGGGNAYDTGSTGGESRVTLTTDEMPPHTHILTNRIMVWGEETAIQAWIGSGSESKPEVRYYDWNKCETAVSGVGNSHNNMPPYRAVYMWYRTA